MIDIVCLKWGNKFGPEYVNNLYKGIKRNSTAEFRFHCFTEDRTDLLPEVIIQELPDLGVDGWWNKVYLFNDQLPFELGEPIMFIDLDTIITGNIDHILTYPLKTMIGLENFYHGTFASGLLMWRHGAMARAWDKFKMDPQSHIATTTDGDQEYTARYLPRYTEYFQDLFPNEIYSYKQSCSKGLPLNARIVCYHGTPSIIQSFTETVNNHDGHWPPQEWVKEYWR